MNRTKKNVYIFISIFALFSGLSFSSETIFELPKEPMEGLSVFIEKKCIECHTLKPGEPSFGPNLKNSLKDDDVFQIYGKMWSHSFQMFRYMDEEKIPHPRFSEKELKSLLDFLYVINFLSEKGEPESGKRFFQSQVCSNCHSIGIYGNTRGIPLDALKVYMSPVGLASLLWNHGPKMKHRVSVYNIKWPALEGDELSGLSEFIIDFSNSIEGKKIFSTVGSPKDGRKIFENLKCSTCHSLVDFNNIKHKDVLSIAAHMWNAGPRMWGAMVEKGITIPEFSPEEFVNITTYLYFIGYPGKKGNQISGKNIFTKNCSQCHTVGPGPSLDAIKGKYKTLEFMLTIWNHTENMHEIAKEKGVLWPKFLGYEINDLIEFMTRPF